jgi:hypothetical protein
MEISWGTTGVLDVAWCNLFRNHFFNQIEFSTFTL